MADLMESKPLYFDNAATSYPKPEEVYLACDRALRTLGNPGRGAHRLALDAARIIFNGREAVADFFAVASERIIFTSGCTASINLALNGLVGAGRLQKGDVVLCSSYEHNAVMRPLHWHANNTGIKVRKVAAAVDHSGLVDVAEMERLVQAEIPALCVFSLASNVTGEILDLAAVDNLCCRFGIPLLVDGAQAAGAIDINLQHFPSIAFFAASAHKNLLGPPGLGLLYVAPGQKIDPPYCGGTGSRSESLQMPGMLPDRLEPGTAAVQLVAGLEAGIQYLKMHGAAITALEEKLVSKFLPALADIPGIKIFGRGKESNGRSHLPTFALAFYSGTADKIADSFDRDFDIAVRPGLHCAVAAHETLGTVNSGLVRISFGAFTKEKDVDQLLQAIKEKAGP